MDEGKTDTTDDLDLSGEVGLEALPPRERTKMRRLRGWLLAKRWTPGEAEAILCGYDPAESASTSPEGLAFLPGAWAFYGVPEASWDANDLSALADGLDRQREAVRGLRLVTDFPRKVIEKVHGVVEIPWIHAASADLTCRKCLPYAARLTADLPEAGAENRGGNRSYGKTLSQFPDWIEQIEYAFEMWKAGKNQASIVDGMKDGGFLNITTGIGKMVERFERGETAETITAPYRAFKAKRDKD